MPFRLTQSRFMSLKARNLTKYTLTRAAPRPPYSAIKSTSTTGYMAAAKRQRRTALVKNNAS